MTPAWSPEAGLLICPTGCGVVLAVDLASQTLAWMVEYQSNETENPSMYDAPRQLALGGRLVEVVSPDMLLAEDRWVGSSVQISGNSVLLTAPDSDELHCVRLQDGERQWLVPREESQFVVAGQGEIVALAGRQQLIGLNQRDGKPVWTREITTPSGQGVREGALYHLPLATSEIATIDLVTGHLLARSPTRSGQTAGNLIAAGGRLFSQTPQRVGAFRAVDDLRRQIEIDLAQTPDDPAALALRGEMKLHADDVTEGLADLRRSNSLQAHPRTGQLIVSTLLEGLRSDFAAHREAIPEIDALAKDPAQRLVFLRTVAEGLDRIGESTEAFDRFLELALMSLDQNGMEQISPGHRVRSDRWTAGRLRDLRIRADDRHQQEFARRIDAAVSEALRTNNAGLLDRTLTLFPGHPTVNQVRLMLVADESLGLEPLRIESLLLTLRESDDLQLRGTATARLARLYATHGSSELAAAMLEELATRYGEVECLPGATGQELAQLWRASDDLGPVLRELPDWPIEKLSITSQRHSSTNSRVALTFNGPVDGQWSGWSFALEGDKLVASDGYGRGQWAHPLGEMAANAFPTTQYVSVRGHLLMVFLGDRFLLLDTLQPGAPRVIREVVLAESVGAAASPWRSRRIVQTQHEGFRVNLRQDLVTRQFVGNVGPLRERQFCYLEGDVLHAIDPVSGEELWSRSDMVHGSEILADDDYVILCPPFAGDRGIVRLHAIDGSDAGPPVVIPSSVQMQRKGADWGRLFLTVRRSGEGLAVGMYDPIRQEQVWERDVSPNFHWAPVDGEDIAIYDGRGGLEFVQATSGESLLQTTVEAPPDLDSLSVLNTPDRWYLLYHVPMEPLAIGRFFLPSVRYELLPVNGPVYAIARQDGEVKWMIRRTNQALDPRLPGRWPVLVFDAPIRSAQRPGERLFAGNIQYQTVEIIRREDGEVLHEQNIENEWRGIDWQLGKDRIRLLFGGTEIALDFSGKPKPTDDSAPPSDDSPEPPGDEPPEGEPSTPTEAFPSPPAPQGEPN